MKYYKFGHTENTENKQKKAWNTGLQYDWDKKIFTFPKPVFRFTTEIGSVIRDYATK